MECLWNNLVPVFTFVIAATPYGKKNFVYTWPSHKYVLVEFTILDPFLLK